MTWMLNTALVLFLLSNIWGCCLAFLSQTRLTRDFTVVPRITRDAKKDVILKSRLTLLVHSDAKDCREDESTSVWNKVGSDEQIANLLVCGDGDLSFSASIAPALHKYNIRLTATVLEDQATHQRIYERSGANQEIISSFDNHRVQFGVDVNNLEELFEDETFDRIQFNFPHWRGKANHRYNRQLIDTFLKNASRLLSESGETYMALAQGQGGYSAKTIAEYRDTWTPNLYASNHGLLLSKVRKFDASYNLSSHRGVDRGFKIGEEPKMFIFTKPNGPGSIIPKRNQLCCRHELHILLPDDNIDDECKSKDIDGTIPIYSIDDIIAGDAVQNIIQSTVPDGIRVEVPSRNILYKSDTGYETNMAVFMIVYCGEYKALLRDEADTYRHLTEIEMEKYVPLRENRKGRLVSKSFPYYLLDFVVQENASYGMMKPRDLKSKASVVM